MILLLPVLAFVLGAWLAYHFGLPVVTGVPGLYLALGCLAGMDTVFGGMRAGLEGKFHNDVFISGFISNVLIASLLAWLGDQIFLNMHLAVVLVLGSRIFTNLSLIRRILLTKWLDAKERERLKIAQKQSAVQEGNP
jgi:small basic protein